MLRTRKTKSNNDTIGGSSSLIKGIKGKRTKQKQILNLFIGFAIVFILGVFFSLFVYDIEDLEEASSVSFRDAGRGKKLDDDAQNDESGGKQRWRNREEKEKEKEEAHSTRSRRSQLGSAVTPNAQRFDVRSSFAQSFAKLSKGGNGGSFPYRYVFALLLYARLYRVFQ